MKIAFVTQQLIIGGAETYIARKCKWLIEHGYEVIIISEGGCYVEMLPKGVKHILLENIAHFPFLLSFRQRKTLLKNLVSILKKENVQVIEANEICPILYVMMSYKRHRINFLLNVLLGLAYDHSWQLCKITPILNDMGLYYTLTTSMHQYIMKKCKTPLNPIILPIPIQLRYPQYYKEDNYILTVGRMAPDKMYVMHLIKAFGDVLKQLRCDVRLLVVGDGNMKTEVGQLVDKVNLSLNREAILLLGTVVGEELDLLYANCMAFVGVGTSMMISAANAKPTIIASVYDDCQPFAFGFWGMKPAEDKLIIGGSSQFAYRKQTYQEMLTTIINANLNERMAYGKAAYSLLESFCSLDVVMREWENQYNNIIQKKAVDRLCKVGCFLLVYNSFLRCAYLVYKKMKHLILWK